MLCGRWVALRPLERADLEQCRAWVNDRALVALTGPYAPVGRRDQEAWFKRIAAGGSDRVFGIHRRRGGRLIGTCGLYDVHWVLRKADLRIRIGDRRALGKGYGSDAVRVLVDHAFRNLNLHRVALTVFADNARAIRAYEKCGFVPEGKLRGDGFIEGRYIDVLVMGILQDDYLAASPDAGSGTGGAG